MEEVAYVDLQSNRCHWTLVDTGTELVAACGATRSALHVRRTAAFADGVMVPGCRDCAEVGQPKTIRSSRPVLVRMSWGEFEAASEAYDGFCISCDEITNSGVEPDARRYECESCGNRTVYGMAEALLSGAIQVE